MKIGILGGGQLALMLTQAAHQLDHETICVDPASEPCATSVTRVEQLSYEDVDQILKLFHDVDVITIENENIPINTLVALQREKPLHPTPRIIDCAQERFKEKTLFRLLNLPTNQFHDIKTKQDLHYLGFPAVVKTRRFGYDGKGQMLLKHASDVEQAWQQLGDQTLILESWVNFDNEYSIISTSNTEQIVFYPLTRNVHRDGILRASYAPNDVPELQQQAEQIATSLIKKFNYIGTLAIEFFQVGNQLFINEIAPRVHNSGHWTIEGAKTSQFSNHIRAITGMPLGATDPIGHSIMINAIGDMPAADQFQESFMHYHDYGKTAKPNRKLGHITFNHPDKTKIMDANIKFGKFI